MEIPSAALSVTNRKSPKKEKLDVDLGRLF